MKIFKESILISILERIKRIKAYEKDADEVLRVLRGLPLKFGMHKFMRMDGKKIRNKDAI